MRAWHESDPVFKFVALFIPLEFMLAGHSRGGSEVLKEHAGNIRRLIRRHAGADREALLSFFSALVEAQRPSLPSRFEHLAREAEMPGWQADVEAFRRFNNLRNKLLHRGVRAVSLQVPISEDATRYLEDIVERYVSYATFGDARVYPSRWR